MHKYAHLSPITHRYSFAYFFRHAVKGDTIRTTDVPLFPNCVQRKNLFFFDLCSLIRIFATKNIICTLNS